MTVIDQAVRQFQPKPGYDLRAVVFESNMTHIPKIGGNWMLIPCHLYFYRDHSAEKIVISHRNSGEDTYVVSGSYFGLRSLDGENHSVRVPTDAWGLRWLGLVGDYEAVGFARGDLDGPTHTVGRAADPPVETVEHIDFMCELQYGDDEEMPFPEVDPRANKIIVRWVWTNNGIVRPADALERSPNPRNEQGDFARMSHAFDAWGRMWLRFWIERGGRDE